MKDEGKEVSTAQMCQWFGFPRSTFYYEPRLSEPRQPKLDQVIVEMIRKIIDENPGYGIRRITAVLRNGFKVAVNRKKVRRIIRINNWQIRRKPQGKRPRAMGLRSIASRPTLGDRHDSYLLRKRRVVPPDGTN